MTNQPAFKVGDLVERSSPDAGYRFPGEVIGLGESKPGRTLYMVKTMVPGCENMVHVFGEKNLQPWDGVSQPSPVLTAEERSFLTFLESRIEGWETYNGKPSKPILRNLLSRTADPDTVTLNMEQAESVLSVALHACVTGDCEHDDVRDCGNELAKFIDVALRRTNIDDMLFGAIKNYYDRKSGEQAPAIPQAEKAREIIERAGTLLAQSKAWIYSCKKGAGAQESALADTRMGEIDQLLADIAAYKEG